MGIVAPKTDNKKAAIRRVFLLRADRMGSSVARMDSNSYSAAVTNNVRAALAGAGLSIAELALQTGIARTTLSRRLAKVNPSPFTVNELKAIADVTGTTAQALATVVVTSSQAVA